MFPRCTDEEMQAQARADLQSYTAAMAREDVEACILIEKRYGLLGLSPQQVSEELHEIAADQEKLP